MRSAIFGMIGYSCNLWHLAMCLPVYSNKTSQLFYNKKPFIEKRNNSTRAPGTNQRVEVSWDPTQMGKKSAGKADTDKLPSHEPVTHCAPPLPPRAHYTNKVEAKKLKYSTTITLQGSAQPQQLTAGQEEPVLNPLHDTQSWHCSAQ